MTFRMRNFSTRKSGTCAWNRGTLRMAIVRNWLQAEKTRGFNNDR